MKYCYICGRKIKDGEFWYSAGPNTYICSDNQCFDLYFWDNLAARMAVDRNHEYAIVDKKVYQIGNKFDDPLGMGGKFWAIQFNDGFYIETNSLWFKGELPERLWDDFKENAKFIAH